MTEDAAFLVLQQFRKLSWTLIVGCSAALLAINIMWLTAPRLRREHAIAGVVIGCIGAVLGGALGAAWDNGSLAYWAAYTAGHALLTANLLLTTAISIIIMWRQ
ncbi:MAG TPA: hypothetical protein PKL67_08350 [Anaerolineae bacterium]|nr:hypothetical protein [Anaerolineae bacterium]